MIAQPNRLPPDAAHGLGGAALDRSKPLRFRLNGRWVEGFAGDTVLSAALASGITTAGTHGDTLLALDERLAPLIVSRNGAPLPMERTPALHGVDYSTLGIRRVPFAARGLVGALRQRLKGGPYTLFHRYGDVAPTPEPWRTASAEVELDTEFLIIGAGVAGLAAAATASAAGRPSILVERSESVGGAVQFFGAVEGEAPPAEALAELEAGLDGKVPTSRLLNAEAFDIDGSTVRVHQIVVENNRPRSRVIAITAQTIILATGALERLPIFAGNRSPGVTGALSAYFRAHRHGVWLGRRAIVSTPHGYAYRLALRAADAGIAVQRIVDTRVSPHSRFIDFAKASGITIASGMAVSHAHPSDTGLGLRVGFSTTFGDDGRDAALLDTDLLIAAGSWQPDLALWLSAGGRVTWDASNSWLGPQGTRDNIVLVGAAAGWRSTTGAIGSARAAVLSAIGKAAPAFEDIRIDPAYETPDAPTPIAPRRLVGSAYLDRGISLMTRKSAAPELSQPVALSISDIAAAVAIGAMQPRDAGPVAAERAGISGDIVEQHWAPALVAPPTSDVPPVPAYLTGRFGARPQAALLKPADQRVFEPGCLVFDNYQARGPQKAVGVVYATPAAGGAGGIALLAAHLVQPGATLYVHDGSDPIPATLVKLKP